MIVRLRQNREYIKELLQLALPLLLTQLIQIVFQLGDQAIIGRTHLHEFAGVSIASSFLFLITGTIGMIAVAFNIIGGRYLGENNTMRFNQAFITSVLFCLFIGVIIELLLLAFGSFVLQSIYGLTGSTLQAATDYLYIGGLTIGLNLILFNFSSYFKNIKKTKIFVISFVPASMVNVFFDYVLVYGKLGFPKLGVSGAAMGSVLGLALNLFIYILAFQRWKTDLFTWKLNKKILTKLVKVYFPLALQDLVEYTLFAIILSSFIARIDATSIAAYSVITTLLEFLLLPIYALSGSCMTLTAQSYGSEKQSKPTYLLMSLYLAFVITLPLSILVAILANPMAQLITDKSSVISLATHILPLAIGFNLINGLQIIIRSALQSMDMEKWVFVYSTCIYTLLLVLIYFFMKWFQLLGVYVGLGIGYTLLLGGYSLKLRKLSNTILK